jgi:pimeloyl-ACP methyl ester carboxylesterase
LLDALRWNCVDVVGWSLGGHIGLQLLATDDRVQSLLIVGTPPVPLRAESLQCAFRASADMDLASKGQFSNDDALAYGKAIMGGRKPLNSELLASIVRTDRNARRLLFASALRGVGVDQRKLVETTNKPLCVVHGELEPFVRLDYLRSLRYRNLWMNRVFVIANAGHAPHWQRPSAFNRVLLEFLKCQKIKQEEGNFALQTGGLLRNSYMDV